MRRKTAHSSATRAVACLGGGVVLVAITVLLGVFTVSSCDNFQLVGLLDGVSGMPLSVVPASTVVAVNQTCDFNAAGGYPPYTYTIARGEGSIDPDTGVFVAPGSDGVTVIAVTDGVGRRVTASAQVTVPLTTDVSYCADWISHRDGSTTNSPFAGAFSYSNAGTDNGTHAITYQVFASNDTQLDFDADFVVAGGTLLGLPAGTSSGDVEFAGTWPSRQGSYFLVLSLMTAPDDLTASDNWIASAGTITLSGPPAPQVDYQVESITNANSPAYSGQGVSETFTIANWGSDAGLAPVYWNAYISTDDLLDQGDTPIDNGLTGPLGSGETSVSIAIDQGSWPLVGFTTDYYLIVQLSSSDDIEPANNLGSIGYQVDQPDVDYAVTTVSGPTGTVETDSAVAETFTVENWGTCDGGAMVAWTAYESVDAILDASDRLVDAGTIAPILAGQSTMVAIEGNWGGSTGLRHLIAHVSVTDDIDPLNNSLAGPAFSLVPPPGVLDYVIEAISVDFPTVLIDSSIAESVTVRNASVTDGAEPIEVVISLSDEPTPGTGVILPTLTTSPLPGDTVSRPMSIDGSWPAAAGTYFLIAEVASADESVTTNNTAVAGPFTVNQPPDYEVAVVLPILETAPEGFVAGHPGDNLNALAGDDHVIEITNIEPFEGRQAISWSACFSTDGVVDAGDEIVASGSLAPLGGEMSTQVPLDPVLPAVPGEYWIIVTASAGDDPNTLNNIVVSGPILVWREVNAEGDVDEDDAVIGQEDDFFVVLKPGDVLTINGLIDEFCLNDLFLVRTGAGATAIQITATWSTGNDSIDLYMFQLGDDPYAPPWASAEYDPDIEMSPTDPYWEIGEFDRYYVNAMSIDDYGGAALPYVLTVSVY
jgi:hypothetical protein